MLIRAATAEDLGAVADLWNAMIRDTTHTFTTVQKDHTAMTGLLAARPDAFLVATQGEGRVAGFVTWGPFRAGDGYRHTAEHSIITATARSGTGRALMQAALSRAQARGIHTMIAAIAAENHAAVAFHAKLGFVSAGRLPQVGHKAGRWHDLILMSRPTAIP